MTAAIMGEKVPFYVSRMIKWHNNKDKNRLINLLATSVKKRLMQI